MKHFLSFLVFMLLLISCGSDDQQFAVPGDGIVGTAPGDGVITGGGLIANDPADNEESEPAVSPNVRTNPPCSSLAFNDGRGGDLWLPVSAGDGLPVYLLNGAWQERARAEAELVSGGFEEGRFTGFNNPDPDGLRQHFRFTRSCEAYAGTVIVTDATQSCEVSIPNVCQRID